MAAGKIDPIHQFEISTLVPLGNTGFGLTNSGLFMILATGLITALMVFGVRNRELIPGRLQSLAEMSYEFVASTVHSTTGREGMKFFPLVFSLFMFVLFLNMLGMLPGGFTVTSHIIITFALALLVILTVIVVGFSKHGLHFLKLFAPSGIPIYVLPIITVIEVVSFLARPVSLSMRLFANMMAGHIALKLFATFVVTMAGVGFFGVLGAVLPLGIAIALTAMEFLVAFIQAYVFTILTCIYLNDALHPGH
ncbi:F0F1 ATP synthase subunit A [Enterovirga rhinocerotis]|uniref:ATP synthase subunit a n=1 Tax=Enterovirga rhinocerotis TaxID=1339210 RepID=A0A4R7C8I0_9HYPH|nr:F0F1 ATP synthase subunit A [Enterovirga rhinocerotis]TDR94553.1 ATP synthase F0 subcomplex A subunit [Enterovirga rhinocerotis]